MSRGYHLIRWFVSFWFRDSIYYLLFLIVFLSWVRVFCSFRFPSACVLGFIFFHRSASNSLQSFHHWGLFLGELVSLQEVIQILESFIFWAQDRGDQYLFRVHYLFRIVSYILREFLGEVLLVQDALKVRIWRAYQSILIAFHLGGTLSWVHSSVHHNAFEII